MTGQQLVNAALALIGVITQGETPSASESADGLLAVNNLLSSWGTERLNVFTVQTAEYPLSTNVSTYQMGPGGTWNTVRPVHFESAQVLVPSGTGSGDLTFPVDLIDQAAFMAIAEKNLSGVVVKAAFPDMGFPLITWRLWPRPQFSAGSVRLQLGQWVPLTEFASLATDLNFPPGYSRALIYNSALEMAPMFGAVPSPLVSQIAVESKAAIRMLNAASPGAPVASGVVNAIAPAAQGE